MEVLTSTKNHATKREGCRQIDIMAIVTRIVKTRSIVSRSLSRIVWHNLSTYPSSIFWHSSLSRNVKIVPTSGTVRCCLQHTYPRHFVLLVQYPRQRSNCTGQTAQNEHDTCHALHNAKISHLLLSVMSHWTQNNTRGVRVDVNRAVEWCQLSYRCYRCTRSPTPTHSKLA